MTLEALPYVVAGWLLLAGLYGIVTSRNLVHLVVCVTVVQSSTYLLLLAVGFRSGAIPPIFPDAPLDTPAVDPIVQSLAVTDAVVSATVTALLLALAIQAHKRTGTLDPDDLRTMRG
ncbi:MAG: NADH-quinone oxidoreductase subunit K [Actinobacteria bacterium]|nr:NADH-quinone oxidoreductase subunit K [Actinomycetota bacterium]